MRKAASAASDRPVNRPAATVVDSPLAASAGSSSPVSPESAQAAKDPGSAQAAKDMGLRYITDTLPGIRRVATGNRFRYLDPTGKPLRDDAQLKRIKSLVIPPAWTDVWICPQANGHIQVTARDARRRKQYRYHQRWREVRDENKYERVIAFGLILPALRARVEADLQLPGMPREKVLATLVRLLETTRMRIGNEEYARNNQSFGLSTLRDKHVEISAGRLQFRFKGKSGKQHHIRFDDARLTRIVRRCRDIPGQMLFQYLDDGGEGRPIGSTDVNDYIREIAGEDYTAKDFRTWAGTVLVAHALGQLKPCTSVAEAKTNVIRAIEAVATTLGNTPAICRKCYVHPAVIEAYLDAALDLKPGDRKPRSIAGLLAEENAVLRFLQRRCRATTVGAGKAA